MKPGGKNAVVSPRSAFIVITQAKTPLMPHGMRGVKYAVPLSLITLRQITGPALTRPTRDGISSVRGSGAHFTSVRTAPLTAKGGASLNPVSGATFPHHSHFTLLY